jgi:hypothetical protein
MAIRKVSTSSINNAGNKNISMIVGNGIFPSVPTVGSVTVGDTRATVPFTAGAAPGTTYTAISSPGNITASRATSPITVTGLTNGVTYTFQVRANNATGSSVYSSSSNSGINYVGGGDASSDATYYYRTFSSNGTLSVSGIASINYDYVLIGGGGGGAGSVGSNVMTGGAGGGAGRVNTGSGTVSSTVAIVIGGAGPGGAASTAGTAGTASSIGANTSTFGNGGAGSGAAGGASGNGFTGGAGSGSAGGGGAGAGANGSAASGGSGGVGGNGISTYSSWGSATGFGQNISGTYWFAGGGAGAGNFMVLGTSQARAGGNGGGGGSNSGGGGTGGQFATGSGGGGAGYNGNGGSAGGSGLCIVRYTRSQVGG